MSKSATKKEYKVIQVEGLAMYAKVHQPVLDKFNPTEPPRYMLEILVDEKEAKKVLDTGLKLTKVIVDEDTKKPKVYPEHPEKKVVTFYRRTQYTKKDGTVVTKTPLDVVDASLNPIPKSILIGNGSKVKVSVNHYINSKGSTSHDLLAVQVLELVPYEKTQNNGLTKTDGFTVNQTVAEEAKGDPLLSNSDDAPWDVDSTGAFE